MISYHKGDLLESGCDIICHQVNLDGVMGGGIAYQIAQKYPNCEEEYREMCQKFDLSGNIHFFAYKDKGYHKFIANCFSQRPNFETDYKWLEKVVRKVYCFAKMYELETIGIPKNYGSGIAKGDWNIVEKIWTDAFKDSENIELQIWEL